MALQEQKRVVLRDFGGLRTNSDPEDVRPGEAVVQVNARPERPGELRVRQGTVRVLWED